MLSPHMGFQRKQMQPNGFITGDADNLTESMRMVCLKVCETRRTIQQSGQLSKCVKHAEQSNKVAS